MMNASPQATKGGRLVRTAHGEAQRQALVDAAYHLIASGGFEHLRTRDVAARAGVNIATLHYYFATKEDLIRGVVDRVHQELATVPPTYVAEAGMPLEELRREFADIEQQMRETPETFLVLFELSLRALRDPAIHQMLDEMDAGWQSRVEAYLADGVRQGMFRADLDVSVAAAALVAIVKGCIVQVAIVGRAFPLDRVAAEVERWLTGGLR
jgi:AcrR family transcriptional regulator